jgi:hypothetical protein
MDTHNLATVITPNILKEKSAVVGQDESSFLAIEVVNTLIEYNDQMCEVSFSPTFLVKISVFNLGYRFPKTSNLSSTIPLSSITALI